MCYYMGALHGFKDLKMNYNKNGLMDIDYFSLYLELQCVTIKWFQNN